MVNNMKTIKQWLNELPSELKASAYYEIKKQCCQYALQQKRESLSGAIHAAFCWCESMEGHDFWAGFYDTLKWAEE